MSGALPIAKTGFILWTSTPGDSGIVPGAGAVKTSTWCPRSAWPTAKRCAVLPAPPGYGGKVAVRWAIRSSHGLSVVRTKGGHRNN